MIVGDEFADGVAEVDNATACLLQQESRLIDWKDKMTKPRNQGQTQSALGRVGQSVVRFLRRINSPAYPGSPPAWTNGMFMAVVLIFFLILLIHPYDALLSRTLSTYEPLNGVRHLTDIGLSQWYLIPAFVIGVCLIGIDWGNIARGPAYPLWPRLCTGDLRFLGHRFIGDPDQYCEVSYRPGAPKIHRYAGGQQFFTVRSGI